MPADTGFSLGFFCGMMLGAVGVYIVATPEGRCFKNTVVEDFKKHQQTFILESIMPDEKKEGISESVLAISLHTMIRKAREFIEKPQSIVTTKELSKTVSVKKKHIFTKK